MCISMCNNCPQITKRPLCCVECKLLGDHITRGPRHHEYHLNWCAKMRRWCGHSITTQSQKCEWGMVRKCAEMVRGGAWRCARSRHMETHDTHLKIRINNFNVVGHSTVLQLVCSGSKSLAHWSMLSKQSMGLTQCWAKTHAYAHMTAQ